MLDFKNLHAIAVGEAMVEFAPTGDGLYRRGFAGDTFNTAWHLTQTLQEQARIGFVTRVGTDQISDAFVAELATDGLDISGICRDPARTMGLYLIELDGVERRFHYWRETSAARGLASEEGFLTRTFFGPGLIHLSGITLAILSGEDRERLFAALAAARANGARISFDPNIRPRLWASMQEVRQTVARVLALTDIALPSFDDEAVVWGDTRPETTIDRFAKAGVTEIAVKDGAGPVMFLSDGVLNTRPTPEVHGIRDTTGAGDGFNAGYLAARLLEKTPKMAVSAGQRFSAEVIRHFGARLPKPLVPIMR